MYIEQWKDTAFGSDYGGDFLRFMEGIETDVLSLELLFNKCNLESLIKSRKSFLENEYGEYDVTLENNSGFEQTVAYEETIIALSAVIIECELNGKADLRETYGTKVVTFTISQAEIKLIRDALQDIHENPKSFVLFEMLPEECQTDTLNDISQMLNKMNACIK